MDESDTPQGGYANLGVKRFIDVVGATFALILFSPLILAAALLVLCIDGRPVLHRDPRIGRGDVPFSLLKFRTLRPHTDALSTVAPEDDTRITSSGLWLRRWRVDEFPQLINVLIGQMSLVGPRPMPPAHAATLSHAERSELFEIRPGITGPDAIFFLAEDAVLAGHADAETIYLTRILPEKIKMQLDYVRHWTLPGDLDLIVQTLRLLWSPAHRTQSTDSVRRLIEHPVTRELD